MEVQRKRRVVRCDGVSQPVWNRLYYGVTQS